MVQRAPKIDLFVFLVFMGHIFLPLVFIFQLSRAPQHGTLTWMLSLYMAGSYVALNFVTGAWSWFGKATRYALPVLLTIVAATTYPNAHEEISISTLATVEPIVFICVGTIFTVVLVLALLGRKLSTAGLELSFPLRGGTYYVAQGGTSRLLNIHVISPSQQYALDILKLNAIGLRARGLYPSDPWRYAVFGAEVASPCEGVVAAAEDGFTDLSPPERDPDHRAGNYVAIECEGATIYLAHLMKGSLCVKSGEHVSKGQALGRVGNSGNTTEPHLHIHAEEGSYPGHFSGKRGIPMRFNGRFLVRNDSVKAPD